MLSPIEKRLLQQAVRLLDSPMGVGRARQVIQGVIQDSEKDDRPKVLHPFAGRNKSGASFRR